MLISSALSAGASWAAGVERAARAGGQQTRRLGSAAKHGTAADAQYGVATRINCNAEREESFTTRHFELAAQYTALYDEAQQSPRSDHAALDRHDRRWQSAKLIKLPPCSNSTESPTHPLTVPIALSKARWTR
jgi:hypothetical protein